VHIVYRLSSRGKRVAAARTKTSFVQFFNDLVEIEACNGNPASGIKRRSIEGDGERIRWLTMDELKIVWQAASDWSDYSRIVRLLALTGCRREEIGGLRWDEIDFDKRQFLLVAKTGRTKKRDRLVFLSEPAFAILQSVAPKPNHPHVFGQRAGSGFSGWSKAKTALDNRISETLRKRGENALAPWVLHDFRRAFETNASIMELADDKIIHAATGHWGKVKTGVQKVYNLNEYEPQRRKLMDCWAMAVLEAVGETSGKVEAAAVGA
jgi:integrase